MDVNAAHPLYRLQSEAKQKSLRREAETDLLRPENAVYILRTEIIFSEWLDRFRSGPDTQAGDLEVNLDVMSQIRTSPARRTRNDFPATNQNLFRSIRQNLSNARKDEIKNADPLVSERWNTEPERAEELFRDMELTGERNMGVPLFRNEERPRSPYHQSPRLRSLYDRSYDRPNDRPFDRPYDRSPPRHGDVHDTVNVPREFRRMETVSNISNRHTRYAPYEQANDARVPLPPQRNDRVPDGYEPPNGRNRRPLEERPQPQTQHNCLSDDVRRELNSSLASWEDELLREYRPNRFDSLRAAEKLHFSFDKTDMSLSKYLSTKTNYLLDAGITDEYTVVGYLWQGLEGQLALATPLREDFDTIESFNRRVKNNEAAARRVYEDAKKALKAANNANTNRSYATANRPYTTPQTKPQRQWGSKKTTQKAYQAPAQDIPPSKRSPPRPCRHCGGDHWDRDHPADDKKVFKADPQDEDEEMPDEDDDVVIDPYDPDTYEMLQNEAFEEDPGEYQRDA
ncbi:uncharacterized protein KY384_003965 [Bacidia gigantensis]|uniref:uncharacterized protein n=1 Tax=Bacidia gigantensis TaxID=2732470 RepID=UPI001D052088|nr:uncharacterized protein KY384_003965 [Bacidia gigantensis]KAG8532324.1 hypothetical protein KY384_003965 [Bacidia gigantensis]